MAVQQPQITSQPVSEVGTEAEAKQFIYDHESSNTLDKVNSIGCYGLGQDCNNVLEPACPDWRTDRVCQDSFWQNYMQNRYTTWAQAKAYWLCIGRCTNNYGTITKIATWW